MIINGIVIKPNGDKQNIDKKISRVTPNMKFINKNHFKIIL